MCEKVPVRQQLEYLLALAEFNRQRGNVGRWICHPPDCRGHGGAIQEAP